MSRQSAHAAKKGSHSIEGHCLDPGPCGHPHRGDLEAAGPGELLPPPLPVTVRGKGGLRGQGFRGNSGTGASAPCRGQGQGPLFPGDTGTEAGAGPSRFPVPFWGPRSCSGLR